MKRIFFRLVWLSIVSVILLSCSDDVKETKREITFDGSSMTAVVQPSIPADAEAAQSITFTANNDWHVEVSSVLSKADNDSGWIRVSPDHGTAGTYTLTISVDKNEAAEPRSAAISIICGDESKDITITQLGAEINPFGMIKRVIVEGSDLYSNVKVNPDGTSYLERPAIEIDYEYDSNDRISAATIKSEKFEDERYEVEYKDGSAILKMEYDGEVDEIEIKLDSKGHPVYFDGETFEYNEAGHLKAFYYDKDDYVLYLYKDGAMIGMTDDAEDVDAKTEKYSKYLDIVYPSRYPSSKTNIDLNNLMFGMDQCVSPIGIFLGNVSFGDYLMEAPFFAAPNPDEEQSAFVSKVSEMTPGTVYQDDMNGDGRIDERDFYVRTEFSSDMPMGIWTFNENQWPVGYECEISKDEYSMAYIHTVTDRISTDENLIMRYIDMNYPFSDPQEIIKTHTFYEVDTILKKTLKKAKVETYPYSVKVEYY